MSIPFSIYEQNLPIGVLLSARFGVEATLFGIAALREQARPWFDKLPDLS